MANKGLAALAVVAVFGLVVGFMWWLLPYPRRNVDYLVMGGLATMISLGTLFLIIIRTSHKGEDVFFKRQRKSDRKPEDV